jgi:hypothetical protein
LGITIGILSNKKNGLQSLLEKLMEEIEIISEGIIEKKEIDNI